MPKYNVFSHTTASPIPGSVASVGIDIPQDGVPDIQAYIARLAGAGIMVDTYELAPVTGPNVTTALSASLALPNPTATIPHPADSALTSSATKEQGKTDVATPPPVAAGGFHLPTFLKGKMGVMLLVGVVLLLLLTRKRG